MNSRCSARREAHRRHGCSARAEPGEEPKGGDRCPSHLRPPARSTPAGRRPRRPAPPTTPAAQAVGSVRRGLPRQAGTWLTLRDRLRLGGRASRHWRFRRLDHDDLDGAPDIHRPNIANTRSHVQASAARFLRGPRSTSRVFMSHPLDSLLRSGRQDWRASDGTEGRRRATS